MQADKKLSTFFESQRNLNSTIDIISTNNLDNFTSERFKLINKMSKMVKFTNNSVNNVISTLNSKIVNVEGEIDY